MDKISVIIPVYNVKDYIIEAVDSVINQTYKNLEIILIDDGSEDGSEIICNMYKKIDSRVKVIHQENKGLSAARNRGLDFATGNYIAFLDPDDAYLSNMLEIMINTIKNQQVDCVLCDFAMEKETKKLKTNNLNKNKSKIYLNKGKYLSKEILIALVEGKINNGVWNKLYKRQLWDNIRFPVGQVYEDLVVNMQILKKAKKIYILNDKLMVYRIHSNSITNTYTLNNIKDLYFAHTEYENSIKNSCLFNSYQYSNICNKNYFIYIRVFLKNRISKHSEKKDVDNLIKKCIIDSKDKINKNQFNIKEKIIYNLYEKNKYFLSFIYKCYVLREKMLSEFIKK